MPEDQLNPDRDLVVTATDCRVIHDPIDTLIKTHRRWQEKLGLIPPPDLSGNLAVQLGIHCEPFIVRWLTHLHGRELSERQRFVRHPTLPFACTLDGVRDETIVEIKTCNPYSTRSEIAAKYAPQVAHQMLCRKLDKGQLAVLRGFSLDEIDVVVTNEYLRKLIARCKAFYECLITMTPPAGKIFEEPPPVPPEQWRTVDLATADPQPNWGMPMIQALRLWSDTKPAAEMHAQAKTDVKCLLPDDVGTVVFGAQKVQRSKNGAVRISEKEMFT